MLSWNALHRRSGWLLLSLLAAPRLASAQDAESLLPTVHVHGFVSPGFILTTTNNYLGKSSRGSFEFTEVGLNFTVPLGDRLRAGLQLFARDLGRRGNYTAQLDWFYLDYKWADWLGIRAGRTKLPFGLYNEINDIDAARVPILLPQSVYPIESRDYLLALTGGEIYGRLDLSEGGAIEYRLYGGTIFLEADEDPRSPYSTDGVEVPYVVGGRVIWETALEGLRIGASLQAFRLELDILVDGLPTPIAAEASAILWVASMEYSTERLVLAAEYSRWHAITSSSEPALLAHTVNDDDRLYFMASLRVTDWLQPGAYYSLFIPNTRDLTGRDSHQNDLALTLRMDINTHWLLKIEGHYMRGTAVLDPRYNDRKPSIALDPHWGVLLVKSTVYF